MQLLCWTKRSCNTFLFFPNCDFS